MPATKEEKKIVVELTQLETDTLGLVMLYIVSRHPEVAMALTKEEREAFLSLSKKFADATGEPELPENVIPFIPKGKDDEILH